MTRAELMRGAREAFLDRRNWVGGAVDHIHTFATALILALRGGQHILSWYISWLNERMCGDPVFFFGLEAKVKLPYACSGLLICSLGLE